MMLIGLAAAFALFFVLPGYWLYEMFAYPGPGPRAKDMEGYQRDSYDTFCEYIGYTAVILAVVVYYYLLFGWVND
jgi:hypothetical protein